MSFLSVRKIAVLFTVLMGLAVAMPSFAQTGGVTGKAVQQDGSACVKCPIIIARQEIHAVYKTKTNKKGEYIYIGLPLGMYKITLQDPSGKPLYYIEQKIGMGNPIEVDFDLPKLLANQQQEEQKEAKANPELAKEIAEQQKQQQEAEKEQQSFTGLKAFFDQGNTFYQQQNYKAAAAAFEKALPLAKGKNLPIVLERLADSYQKAKEDQKAVDTYQKAIQLTPNDAKWLPRRS